MGSYVQSTLTKDEKVAHVGMTSPWSLSPTITAGLLFILMGFSTKPLFLVGSIFLLTAYIRYVTTELAITNKRVIAKFGFIRRSTIELNIDKVESIQVVQSIFGRIFNYGSLTISGAGNPQAPVPGISNPMGFRNSFIECQEQATQQKAK